MTTPSSGPISIGNVSTEIGSQSTTQNSLGSVPSRNLAGVPNGAISLKDMYDKTKPSSAASTGTLEVTVLIVGGGGGGGTGTGGDNRLVSGGGGAGGYVTTKLTLQPGVTTVTVGAGGAPGATPNGPVHAPLNTAGANGVVIIEEFY